MHTRVTIRLFSSSKTSCIQDAPVWGRQNSKRSVDHPLPICVKGNLGKVQTYAVPGSTIVIIGRPMLKAFKIHLNNTDDMMTMDEGDWKPITMGSGKEHLVKLDDGRQADKIAMVIICADALQVFC